MENMTSENRSIFDRYNVNYIRNIQHIEKASVNNKTLIDKRRQKRRPLQDITSSSINKKQQLPHHKKKNAIINTKSLISQFNKPSNQSKSKKILFEVKSFLSDEFTVLENRGLNYNFQDFFQEINSASKSIDLSNPIVGKCMKDWKTVANWFKFHKYEFEVQHSPEAKPPTSNQLPEIVQSEDKSITQTLEDTRYIRPIFRETGTIPTHKVMKITESGKFMYTAILLDIQKSSEVVVLLCRINPKIEVKAGDDIKLDSLCYTQMVDNTPLNAYMRWELVK